VHARHQRAHQPLDMAAKAWRAGWAVIDTNAMLLAAALECVRVKFLPIIKVQNAR
jgi:hypothetical protein